MRCYCCRAQVAVGRKVKLRPWREFAPGKGAVDWNAYAVYEKEMTFRWAVVCLGCYRRLDNGYGVGETGGRLLNLAGSSRADKAAVLNEAKYRAWQRKEAAKLGLQGAM